LIFSNIDLWLSIELIWFNIVVIKDILC